MKNDNSKKYTVTINALSHDGRGIAHIDGKTSFISGAITGETVECVIMHRHSRYNEGKMVTVLNASPLRVTPECQHFMVCGGCSMQHLAIEEQLRLKEQTLFQQLKHFGQVTPDNKLPPITGEPWHYRDKARLGVRFVQKKERLLIGFREKFSRYLADIKHCPVLHKSVGEHLPALAELIASLSQYEHIPQIEIAIGDNKTALVFRHMTPLSSEDIEKIIAFAKQYNFHIYLQPNPPEPIQLISPKNHSDKLSYTLADYQLTMQFHPLDFTQINGELNPLMIKQALALLDPKSSETVLDLFCGLGNFTLPLARFAKKVIGVEGCDEMVKRAKDNAEYNHIKNTEFYTANLMAPLPNPIWMKEKIDKLLLDPPRTGAKEIIPYFKRLKVQRIVYVSCNPATLARDAKELVHTYGYRLTKAGIINMFPHTSHIEAMGLFEAG